MAQVVLSNKCKQPFKHALVLSSIIKNISSFFKISHSLILGMNATKVNFWLVF